MSSVDALHQGLSTGDLLRTKCIIALALPARAGIDLALNLVRDGLVEVYLVIIQECRLGADVAGLNPILIWKPNTSSTQQGMVSKCSRHVSLTAVFYT